MYNKTVDRTIVHSFRENGQLRKRKVVQFKAPVGQPGSSDPPDNDLTAYRSIGAGKTSHCVLARPLSS